MKTTVKLTIATLIAFAAWNAKSTAQIKTIYVMKDGEVVFQSSVSEANSMTFEGVATNDALSVHKNDGSPVEKIQLAVIRQLDFTADGLSIACSEGNATYAFEDIAKVVFEDLSAAEINNSSKQNAFEAFAYATPEGNVVLETSLSVQSLAVFSIEGKLISEQTFHTVKAPYSIPLQGGAAGVYLLRIETAQGTLTKKIVKP